MITIEKLDYERMKGVSYATEIRSDRYPSIEPQGEGFLMEWRESEKEIVMPFHDEMLSDWLEDPAAFGAYADGRLIGYAEGFPEKWNNRYRIANICVFDARDRHAGTGQLLLDRILREAKAGGARMTVPETQSFNAPAIRFYRKNGFEIIGFDRYAYSNRGPEERNMRIEMGRKR